MALVDDLAAEAVAAGSNRRQREQAYEERVRAFARAFAQAAGGINYDDALLLAWQELSRVMARRQQARQAAEAQALAAARAAIDSAVNAVPETP